LRADPSKPQVKCVRKTNMKILILALVWATLVCALSAYLAIINALNFYPATFPTMCFSGIAASLAWFGLIFRRLRSIFLAICSLLLMFLIIPWFYALGSWPGGDDGGMLGWILIMGGASVISVPIAMIIFFVSVRRLVWASRGHPESAEKPAKGRE